jgi:NAD(P)-dependent dehydrogenase (short-subunit alcohol dehydrogenase family)
LSGALEGRTAIITGASSGIGLATANLFHDEGAHVHAAARRKDAIIEGAGEQRLASGRFEAHALDVADAGGVEWLVREVGERDGVDVLILAAGTNVPERGLDTVTPESWDRILATNLSGAFYFMRAALPYLRASRGDAVLISSVSGTWPDVSGVAYQASKLGMIGLSRAAGFEEHGRGVRFSTILPGLADTAILDNRPEPPPEAVRKLALRPEDVAAACLFLVTLPPRAHVPELTMVPTAIQALGKTAVATPRVTE